ncbi:hypothetical protein M758_7G111300 [Ceratodon purpureus]|nr:hypothetical protein M758_7G111300 [Ceratodon purpureus]
MAATMVRNAFVYGSLLAPEVLTVLLQRVPRSSPAVVHDYHRYSIKNRIYPAVLPKKGDKVFGKVLFDLSEQELHILDRFEDIEYTKLIVSPLTLRAHENDSKVVDSAPNNEAQEINGVDTLENGLTLPNDQTGNMLLGNNTIEISPGHSVELGLATEVPAYMYIWAKQGDPDLFGDWDYELWRANHLQTFLRTDSGFSGSRSNSAS